MCLDTTKSQSDNLFKKLFNKKNEIFVYKYFINYDGRLTSPIMEQPTTFSKNKTMRVKGSWKPIIDKDSISIHCGLHCYSDKSSCPRNSDYLILKLVAKKEDWIGGGEDTHLVFKALTLPPSEEEKIIKFLQRDLKEELHEYETDVKVALDDLKIAQKILNDKKKAFHSMKGKW